QKLWRYSDNLILGEFEGRYVLGETSPRVPFCRTPQRWMRLAKVCKPIAFGLVSRCAGGAMGNDDVGNLGPLQLRLKTLVLLIAWIGAVLGLARLVCREHDWQLVLIHFVIMLSISVLCLLGWRIINNQLSGDHLGEK